MKPIRLTRLERNFVLKDGKHPPCTGRGRSGPGDAGRDFRHPHTLARFRGMREADLKTAAAARILAQISLLMSRFPRIFEIDLNPVSLGDDEEGAVALDARVLIDQV
ncbi:MAG: acetate--CoA ligase family protein [Syntrophobacteraceae bacterium]|nr:acetate--CoA ligase family protein [Syntrophobacteraceae bacterium]